MRVGMLGKLLIVCVKQLGNCEAKACQNGVQLSKSPNCLHYQSRNQLRLNSVAARSSVRLGDVCA